MKFWFAENLPSYMKKLNKNFTQYDNPIIGFGCQAIYDPTYELVYFTKKEFIPTIEEDLLFDEETGVPYYFKEVEPAPFTDDAEAVDTTPN